MIAVDTNVLIYAFRTDALQHESARARLAELAAGPAPWGIATQVIAEFLRVTTFPRRGAVPPAVALTFIQALVDAPSCRVLAPGSLHWPTLRSVVEASGARGNLIHDAALIAVCVENGVSAVLSEDRGLRRFDEVTVVGLQDSGTARERASRYRSAKRGKARAGSR